jgi:hypothetical protein
MNAKASIPLALKAGPMAMLPHILRRVEDIESESSGTYLIDPADERPIGGLVRAQVGSTLLPPAPLSPVGYLAAFDGDGGGRSPEDLPENAS